MLDTEFQNHKLALVLQICWRVKRFPEGWCCKTNHALL